MANYTITAAWLDRETVKYSLNNNSIRPAWTGSNIENVSCTATTISFAQGQTIRVMTLDPVGGGVRVTSTTSRSIPRQQPVPPPPQQQHDRRRASTENNNNNNIRNDYGDSGLAGNIGGWLGRRWGIALRHFIHEGCNMDVNHMFFLLIPFIPFIILYLILK